MLSPPTNANVETTLAIQPSVDVAAVVVSIVDGEPQILVRLGSQRGLDRLPSGPLVPGHRTIEAGLRSWVTQQTTLPLGYVEQLYTFGDVGRQKAPDEQTRHYLSIAYLALVRHARPSKALGAVWKSWYQFFPWEDFRAGRPAVLDDLAAALVRWSKNSRGHDGELREERVELAFGFGTRTWDDERVLERFELLYEAGLVREASRKSKRRGSSPRLPGLSMDLDHRRIVATAISRLRGKIKYRPIVFELMPDTFTLLELQATVESLSGVRLHKQNFRRLVEGQGLVEETGSFAETGGRPARLVRFRRDVLRERPAPGVRLPAARRQKR